MKGRALYGKDKNVIWMDQMIGVAEKNMDITYI
jgi:hypothetical protein